MKNINNEMAKASGSRRKRRKWHQARRMAKKPCIGGNENRLARHQVKTNRKQRRRSANGGQAKWKAAAKTEAKKRRRNKRLKQRHRKRHKLAKNRKYQCSGERREICLIKAERLMAMAAAGGEAAGGGNGYICLM